MSAALAGVGCGSNPPAARTSDGGPTRDGARAPEGGRAIDAGSSDTGVEADGGGLRTGRWVQYPDRTPHNNLLVSVLNIFGDPSTTFGDPRCCTGALPNLV